MNSVNTYNIACNIVAEILKKLERLENQVETPFTGLYDYKFDDRQKEIKKLKEMLLFWNQYIQNIDSWGYDNNPFME